MFGLKTRLRRYAHRRLREIVGNTPLVYGGAPERAEIAPDVSLVDAILNVSSGTIRIERFAFCGHGVALLTGTHDPELRGRDRMLRVAGEGRDIVVESGAWLASNVTVLGPCRVGRDAVVAAGAVVTHDVAPGEIVAGVPARNVGWVSGYGPPGDSAPGDRAD